MKPFVLMQHDKDAAAVQALRAEEIEAVGGALQADAPKGNTITVVGNNAGTDDGADDW